MTTPARPHTRVVALPDVAGDPWHASAPPLYQTATFAQESAEGFGRYDYARSGNPTRETLERHCAELDGGCRAFAYASGVAAIAAVAGLLKPGDEIVAHDDLYGGSHRLFSRVFEPRGISVRYANLVDADDSALQAALSPRTRLVFVESVTNPLLRVPDLAALARAARRAGALLAVDATAMSPWFQRPIEHGADLVVHSATKLLNGHGDVTAGIVVAREEGVAARLAFHHNAEGAVLGPFDAWLLLRGMRTLGVRLDRQAASAARVAEVLSALPGATRVRHLSLADHPDRARHQRQASGAGVLVAFETGNVERSVALVESLKRFAIAVSFGSIASTASLPCRMSHASIPAAERTLPEDLIRLSIGLEDPQDLIEDLSRALRRSSESSSPRPSPIPQSARPPALSPT
ncbi:MAG: aminotransferase class V-fold PLP-dependent enzyme [Phycisphaerae bacterium]|nr:aminotransferase class V-fold PLP-dependent enzyme [Phycisphaerae bacterium]